MQGHHARHRSAVVAIVDFSDVAGMLKINVQIFGDVGGHFPINLSKQVTRRRIKGVIQVKNPAFGLNQPVLGCLRLFQGFWFHTILRNKEYSKYAASGLAGQLFIP
jgi:hypothetical protein